MSVFCSISILFSKFSFLFSWSCLLGTYHLFALHSSLHPNSRILWFGFAGRRVLGFKVLCLFLSVEVFSSVGVSGHGRFKSANGVVEIFVFLLSRSAEASRRYWHEEMHFLAWLITRNGRIMVFPPIANATFLRLYEKCKCKGKCYVLATIEETRTLSSMI